MPEVKRTKKEIDDVLNELDDAINDGTVRFPGMSYESGVQAGILWLLGDTDDPPYPEE